VVLTNLILMRSLLSGQAAVVVVVRNSDGQPLLTSHGDRFFTAGTKKKWRSCLVLMASNLRLGGLRPIVEKLKVQSHDGSMVWPLFM